MTITLNDIASLPARIRSRINEHGGYPTNGHTPTQGECWSYAGYHSSAGYPYATANGKYQPAHRAVWFYLTGDPIEGLDLDHLCRNTRCVNPGHCEPVTHAENQARIAKFTTGCRRAGHDWSDPNNVRTRPNGSRYCAQCDRDAQHSKYVAKGGQHGTQTECPKGHPYSGDNLIISKYPDGRFRQRRCRACAKQRSAR